MGTSWAMAETLWLGLSAGLAELCMYGQFFLTLPETTEFA